MKPPEQGKTRLPYSPWNALIPDAKDVDLFRVYNLKFPGLNLQRLPANHPLLTREVFGPLAAIVRVPDLAAAIAAHNSTAMGLVGALFTQDAEAAERFLTEAQAGMLSINRARPAVAADGPFISWKASGYGPPEHGRWNRDFYTRTQAIYSD